MLYKVKLKNSPKTVLISEDVYNYLSENEYFKSIRLLDNLRIHSSGYAFYQKNYPQRNGQYKNVTIYLHKAIADKFMPAPPSDKKLFIYFKNGNPLDCKVENLEWVPMSQLRRNQRKFSNSTGYRGVIQVSSNKFRAVLYKDKKRFDLGVFETAESAAKAYNAKSQELFGKTSSLNNLK
jgi:hypothetical protein